MNFFRTTDTTDTTDTTIWKPGLKHTQACMAFDGFLWNGNRVFMTIMLVYFFGLVQGRLLQFTPEWSTSFVLWDLQRVLNCSPRILWGAGMAQSWEHWPPTNVARVRFPDPASYVGRVCWFSNPRDFLLVLRFPLSSKTSIWLDLC